MNLIQLVLITTATTFLFLGCAIKHNAGQDGEGLKSQTIHHMPNYPLGL